MPTLLKLASAPMPQKLHKVTGEMLQRFLREHDASPHDLFVDFKQKGGLK